MGATLAGASLVEVILVETTLVGLGAPMARLRRVPATVEYRVRSARLYFRPWLLQFQYQTPLGFHFLSGFLFSFERK